MSPADRFDAGFALGSGPTTVTSSPTLVQRRQAPCLGSGLPDRSDLSVAGRLHLPWTALPETGLWFGPDRVEATTGVDPGRRLAGLARNALATPGQSQPNRHLDRRGRQQFLPSRKRGVHSGPNPTDRGKQGCKRHVLTDRNGVPLVVQTGRANQNDEQRFEGLLRWLPSVPTQSGKPRRVGAVLADAAYGVAWVVAMVVSLGYRTLMKPRSKAGRVHGSGLVKKRYVVERSMAWLDKDRRLRVCYERSWGSWQALPELSACVFCARRLDATRQTARRVSHQRF